MTGRRRNEPPCPVILSSPVFLLLPWGGGQREGGQSGAGGVPGFMRVLVSSIWNPFFSLVPGGAEGEPMKITARREGGTRRYVTGGRVRCNVTSGFPTARADCPEAASEDSGVGVGRLSPPSKTGPRHFEGTPTVRFVTLLYGKAPHAGSFAFSIPQLRT